MEPSVGGLRAWCSKESLAKGVLWFLLRAGRTAAWHSANSKTNKNACRVGG